MPEAFTQEEELNLRDLYTILKRYRRSLLITPVAFALGAFLVATFLISPKYQATATIRIGQVDKVPLESAVNLEARMHDASFLSTVVDAHQSAFIHTGDNALVLMAKKLKDTELVGLTLTSSTPAGALAKAAAVVATVQDAHTVLFQMGVDSIKRQIDITESQIASLKADMDIVIRHHNNGQGLNTYNAVLDGFVVQDRANQMRILAQYKFNLETSLNPAITFNTQLLGKVFVSDMPVSPNVRLITLMALLLGFFLAVVAAFVRNALGGPPLQA